MSASFFTGDGGTITEGDAFFRTSPTLFLKKKKLMAIIQPMTGLLPTSVIWEKDPRPMVSDVDQALVTMSIKTSDYLGGADDKRRTFIPGVGTALSRYELELTGQRTITLTIKCEVYGYQQEAYDILEPIRTLLNANLELSTADMCFQTCNLITDLPTSYDNRVVNVGVLEIQLGLVSSYVALDQEGFGWIETVNTTDIVPGDFT